MNPSPSAFEELVRENAALKIENACLQRKVTTLESEKADLIAENVSLVDKFKEYMQRHPKRFGVKSGKAYEIKLATPQNSSSNNPDESLEIKRKPGGQPGHKGHSRKKSETITKTEIVDVCKCPHCGNQDLSGIQETRTRLVEDVPISHPEVTEYTIHRRYCNCCRKLVEEPILTVLPHAKLGLTVMLIVVWLKIGMRLTEEAIPQILEQLCGIRISEGEVSHICTIIAEEFGEFYAQLENEVRQAQARYIDETSWRENGKTLWMWAFVTKGVALYKIAKSRGHEVPLEVLGENPNGIDVHDRFRAYDKLQGKTGNRPQQLCWFHILADSKDLAELHGVEGELIHNGLKTVFDEANKFEHTGTPVDVEKLIEKLGQVLERDFSKLKCRKFAKTIYKERDKLFLFVTNPEVDGTNNRAERAIRPNVVYRKISGGTRSAVGTKRYAVLGSVFQTFKLKGWNFVGKGLEIIRTSG
jgi:hypothetical protein